MQDEKNGFFYSLLNSLGEGVYFTNRERKITFWNKAAEQITGYRTEEVLDRCCSESILMHVDSTGRRLCLEGCPLANTLSDGKPREAEIYLHHKDGHRVPVRVRVSPVVNESGQIVGAVEIFSNNAIQMQMAERLAEMERLALVDSLTGLVNRRFLESHMRSRLEELRRNNWPFGVLFIDIDGFKNVNDAYGHDIGDQVIKMVGRTLDRNSRYFDAVGRWGGDEFLAVTANIHNGRLRDIAERFRMLVERSAITEPLSLSVTVSIGGALACADDTMESLLRRTDEKLYMAKQSGRNCVRF